MDVTIIVPLLVLIGFTLNSCTSLDFGYAYDGPEIINLPHNFFGSKISAKLAGRNQAENT